MKKVLSLATLILSLGTGLASAQDLKVCGLAREKPDLSISACTRIITGGAKGGRAAAFHNRGIAYAGKGDLQRALADISEGIRLDPKPAYRYQERGEIYHRAGNLDQAIADLSVAIRLDASQAFRFHSRANALKDNGELERALRDYSEAIRLDPTRGFRFFSRAVVYRDLHRYDEAIADFAAVIRLEPNNASALMERGLAYAIKGDLMRAEADLNAAIAADPSNAEIRAARDTLSSGGRPEIGEPSTAAAPEGERTTFYICSRAGCTVTVSSSGGFNTANAWALGHLLEADAIDWCEGYVMPDWREQGGIRKLNGCVRETLAKDGGRDHRIAANCPAGVLTAPDGRRWRLADAKRRGRDVDPWETWELLGKMDPNERPPFEANGSQFRRLCPIQAQRWQVE
ncbi:tetratricopeptide repeat protein [Microvirga massiliensis]|uniref:tetratricopeptide repeat protein n=1 Tax=Microvirga massiliensis TaxID=1033741 RepID=UPI000AEA0E76|nr:tetratricopeptide repeat protein [Microvirga massiliensis]